MWNRMKGWCFFLTSQTVACRLSLLLWFVIMISQSFSGQSVLLTITARKCRLRGVFHYMFDVKAARKKRDQVKTGQLFGDGAAIKITQRALWGEFKHGWISFYFFPVRIILFTVVHYCNCLASFSTTVSFSLSDSFMAPDSPVLSVTQHFSNIVLFIHTP